MKKNELIFIWPDTYPCHNPAPHFGNHVWPCLHYYFNKLFLQMNQSRDMMISLSLSNSLSTVSHSSAPLGADLHLSTFSGSVLL